MSCTKIKSTYKSKDCIHDISYHVWFPQGEVKGIVQLSHGMCEYILRYNEFAEFMVSNGYVVCGNDHLGHGDSINSDDDLGYFCEKDGWQIVVKDMFTLTRIMKKNYPNIPYFMFGHSMGSFLSRAYCIKYGKHLDGVVFCGTSGGIAGITGMISLVNGLERAHGDRYRSKAVDSLAFGKNNDRIARKITPHDWISRDKEIVEKYKNDKKCTFIFTLNGFDNLMRVLWYVSNEKWYSSFRKNLPVFLIAGDSDPIGDYGKGVEKVYDKMKNHNCNVEFKLYVGARHELINETNRSDVYQDVLKFFNKHL